MILTTLRVVQQIKNCAVVVDGGIIRDIGPVDKIFKKYPQHHIHRLQNAVIMPGLVNVHTHLELPPLLEIIRSKTFPDWVLNLIKEKNGLRSKNYKTAISKNIEELIKTGTTTVGEICTHGISPSFLKQSGLRATVFHEIIYMNPSSRISLPSSLIPRPSSLIPRPSSIIKTGLSPHAPLTVSEAALREIRTYARKYNLPLSMHVAESKDELRLLQRKKSGFDKLYKAAGWELSWAPEADSPVEYLKRLGLLNPGFLAVHAVQVTDNDIKILKKTRTPIAHCPRSNKETNVGKMPLKKFLDAGITVGLGTDSLASSPSLSMWDEMRYAYQIHRRDGVSAEDIFRMATINGAKAIGMDKEIGSLEPGKKADIIAVPLPQKNTGDIYSDLLRETKSCIMSVVNGKILFDESSKFRVRSSK